MARDASNLLRGLSTMQLEVPIPRRLPWADLLKRVFGVDALRCQCGKSMRLLAAITDLAVARRVLTTSPGTAFKPGTRAQLCSSALARSSRRRLRPDAPRRLGAQRLTKKPPP
jgi:hypothetical protein